MADVNKLAPFILKWEGGFVNDPDDLGGATNMGVTIGTYEAYCRKKGYPKPTVERLKNITKKDIVHCLLTLKTTVYSNATKRKYGSAPTAAKSSLVKKLRKNAPYALIRRDISNCM